MLSESTLGVLSYIESYNYDITLTLDNLQYNEQTNAN